MAGLYQNNASFTYIDSAISIFHYGGTSCEHPIRTINENMRIAAKYGLSKKEVLLFKAKVIPINILKLLLTRLGLWNRLYRIMKEDMLP